MDTSTILKTNSRYLGEENINGIPCSVGYIQETRLRWYATQMNAFVMIGTAPGKISGQLINDFSARSFQYALNNNKGLPRGVFSAIASIAILQCNDPDKEAIQFCTGTGRKHWSAYEVPVLLDTEKRQAFRFKSYPFWGLVFYPWFAETIDSITGKLADMTPQNREHTDTNVITNQKIQS